MIEKRPVKYGNIRVEKVRLVHGASKPRSTRGTKMKDNQIKTKHSFLTDLLKNDYSLKNHDRNHFLQKIYTFTQIIKEKLKLKEPLYNLGFDLSHLMQRKTKSTNYVLQSLKCLTLGMWDLAPQIVKSTNKIKI